MNTTDTVHLGKTDLEVSLLGIGTWQWGDSFVWNYGKGYNIDDLRTAFQTTLDSGIDFFDTAEMYGFGKSESMLGQFIEATGRRPYVATKFFPLPWRLRR